MRPSALDRLPETARVYLDVREDLRAGREPFARIMAAVDTLSPDGVLVLRVSFEPVPLYRVLARRGFAHWTESSEAEDWLVWFYREGATAAPAAGNPSPATPVDSAGAAPPAAASTVRLDVRGLEPPLPMVRVLEAVETLAPGQRLEVLHHRRPIFLYPQLEARGCRHATDEPEPGLVRIAIWRGTARGMIPLGVHSGRAPSATLPLAYLATAAAAFVLAALALPGLGAALTGHYYHPRLLALTHVVTLGWVTLAIMGASYQLIPVVIERPLFSERLARWQLPALAAGVMGMVGHFWIGRWDGLAWAAALVGAGVLCHVINVALSVRGLARWSFTTRGVALALAGLALTAAFGVTLAITQGARGFPGGLLGAVHAHFHLALLGWIAPMIVAVAARVYPMFLLAPEPGGWGASIQLGGLGLGVPVVTAGLALGRPTLIVSGPVAVAVALGAHVRWVAGFARRRKRPTLDWGLRFVLTGTACLVLSGGTWAGARARRRVRAARGARKRCPGARRLGLADHRRHDAQDRAVPGLVSGLRAAGWS